MDRSRTLSARLRLALVAALVAGTASAAASAHGGEPAVHQIPSAVPADCSRPVDQEINAWLAGVPDGAIARFAENGCYAQVGELQLTDRRRLVVDGNGSTFRAVTDAIGSQRRQWRVTGGEDIALTDMEVVGRLTFRGPYTRDYYPADEWQHGILLQGVQRVRVEGVTIRDVLGDFVEAGPDVRTWPYTPTRDLTVIRSRLDGSGRQGVSVTHGERVAVTDSFLGSVNMNVIDVEADEPWQVARDVSVRGNEVGPLRFSFLANAGQGGRGGVGDVEVVGNTMRAMPGTCQPSVLVVSPDETLRDGYRVRGNTFLAFQRAVSLTGVSSAEVTGNQVDSSGGDGGCGRDWGVDVVGSDGVSVTRNSFRNVSEALHVEDSTNVHAADNTTGGGSAPEEPAAEPAPSEEPRPSVRRLLDRLTG